MFKEPLSGSDSGFLWLHHWKPKRERLPLAAGAALAYNRRVSELAMTPIDGSTRFCAVLGYPVRHSASPAFQNAGIQTLGLNWRYLAFEVHPRQLRTAIAGAQAMNFIGVNLTVPHKQLAFELVDERHESAQITRAVNTIRFEGLDPNGAWQPLHHFGAKVPIERRSHGFNTDADAISRSLQEDLGIRLPGAQVLVLGAGGAGSAAALRFAAEGVKELHLVNRTAAKAQAVAAMIQTQFPAVKAHLGYPGKSMDLLVNATSLGLHPGDALPWEATQLSLQKVKAVYDMIYRPAETPLLAEAKAAGCRVANGMGMLLYQGAAALEIWTGRRAPIQVMRQALEKNLQNA